MTEGKLKSKRREYKYVKFAGNTRAQNLGGIWSVFTFTESARPDHAYAPPSIRRKWSSLLVPKSEGQNNGEISHAQSPEPDTVELSPHLLYRVA